MLERIGSPSSRSLLFKVPGVSYVRSSLCCLAITCCFGTFACRGVDSLTELYAVQKAVQKEFPDANISVLRDTASALVVSLDVKHVERPDSARLEPIASHVAAVVFNATSTSMSPTVGVILWTAGDGGLDLPWAFKFSRPSAQSH